MTRHKSGSASGKNALRQLATRCGITADYHDIWGKPHPTSDETRVALLTAMGFPADVDAAQLLRAEEEQEWRQPLPPVLVTRLGEAEALSIPISLPLTRAGRRHQWILAAESGVSSSGDFLPSELPRRGERRLGNRDYVRHELTLPAPAEIGYYRLELEEHGRAAQRQAAMTLIVAPAACFHLPAVKADQRTWGLAVQLYGVRSKRNW
ncbi:MAG: hypothetical protein ABI478_06820, partial [Propionivibrio sp.]